MPVRNDVCGQACFFLVRSSTYSCLLNRDFSHWPCCCICREPVSNVLPEWAWVDNQCYISSYAPYILHTGRRSLCSLLIRPKASHTYQLCGSISSAALREKSDNKGQHWVSIKKWRRQGHAMFNLYQCNRPAFPMWTKDVQTVKNFSSQPPLRIDSFRAKGRSDEKNANTERVGKYLSISSLYNSFH